MCSLSRRLVPAVLPFALLLTACAGPPAVVMAPRPQIPASLRSCRAEPVPDVAMTDDSVLARYIVDLANAGRDCRAKLGALSGAVG